MNLKNWKYMKSAEFKARQVWLKFTDAAGCALEIIAEVKEQAETWLKTFIKNCRAGWTKNTPTPKQLNIVFRNKNGQFIKI